MSTQIETPADAPKTETPAKTVSYSELEEDVLRFWEEHDVFAQSIAQHANAPSFVFFEGPPTANGKPGIHHVIARTIKDLVCRSAKHYHGLKTTFHKP